MGVLILLSISIFGCGGSTSDIQESLTEESLPYGVAYRETNDFDQITIEVKSDDKGDSHRHEYTYNSTGLKSSETILNKTNRSRFITYEYDSKLKLIKQVETISYPYDGFNPDPFTLIYTYDQNGNISAVSRNGSPYQTYVYNENNVLEKIEYDNGSYTLFDSKGQKTENFFKSYEDQYSYTAKYNQHGKVSEEVGNSTLYPVKYHYTENGFISKWYQEDILERKH